MTSLGSCAHPWRAMASISDERLTAGELETAGRLMLGELPERVVAGSWWGYHPAEATVTYPTGLLSEWPMEKLIAAMSHEAAEARFTGAAGAQTTARWIERMIPRGLTPAALSLLVNTVNDMRVNRLQIARYPGLAPLFQRLYEESAGVEAAAPDGQDDEAAGPPLPHQYVDGLLDAWMDRQWPGSGGDARLAPGAKQAVDQTIRAALAAAEHDRIEDLLEAIEIHVLPTYEALIQEERAARRSARANEAREAAPDAADPGTIIPADVEEAPDRASAADATLADAAPAESESAPAAEIVPRDPEVAEPPAAPPSEPPTVRPGKVKATDRPQPAGSLISQLPRAGGEPWNRGVISKARRDEVEQIDYENFDYLAAVRKLEPLIREAIFGDGRRPGLADIMNRRRQGSIDPWRRPRTQRSGDSGEIDLEHPERLVTEPSVAFLRGVRIARADRQRDFADAILLDISGSMVQRGFPTRKFDRLVEAAVIFIEIHERLKIPFEVLSFSNETVVHWAFDRCAWTSTHIDAAEAYTPRDHGDLIRAMYALDHKDTDDAGAVRTAARDTVTRRGLKSVLVVTDGISSDPPALRRVLANIDRRNRNAPNEQRLKVLAFGVGVVRSEFEAAYVPRDEGKALRSCSGAVVEDSRELPRLIRNAVDRRIRYA